MKKRIVPVVAATIAGVFLLSSCSGTFKNNEQTRTCNVTDKQIITTSNGDNGIKHEYRVFTDNCDVLVVVDAFGRWDSASRYNQVKVGQENTFVTWGTRNGLMGWFPNIVEVK